MAEETEMLIEQGSNDSCFASATHTSCPVRVCSGGTFVQRHPPEYVWWTLRVSPVFEDICWSWNRRTCIGHGRVGATNQTPGRFRRGPERIVTFGVIHYFLILHCALHLLLLLLLFLL
ncbi:uncharacterized protein LOC112684294 [Sipha flava]|uniref:Uncharacterized protein LOC112684294 n=1 Tax=Sipha flava TaxID=143950 RepID=A0A8B8FMD3_9HEMI|nr:uncharacterized protein LOC112684294 [Sipha flava]